MRLNFSIDQGLQPVEDQVLVVGVDSNGLHNYANQWNQAHNKQLDKVLGLGDLRTQETGDLVLIYASESTECQRVVLVSTGDQEHCDTDEHFRKLIKSVAAKLKTLNSKSVTIAVEDFLVKNRSLSWCIGQWIQQLYSCTQFF